MAATTAATIARSILTVLSSHIHISKRLLSSSSSIAKVPHLPGFTRPAWSTASISHSLRVVPPCAYRLNTIRCVQRHDESIETIVAPTMAKLDERSRNRHDDDDEYIETIVARTMAKLDESIERILARTIPKFNFSLHIGLHQKLDKVEEMILRHGQQPKSLPSRKSGRLVDVIAKLQAKLEEDKSRSMKRLKSKSGNKHWLIVMDRPAEGATVQQMVNSHIQTLAKVLGSEEEADKKIYNVYCDDWTYGFGCEIDEEASNKLKDLRGVLSVLPDYYIDEDNEDCGAKAPPLLGFTRPAWSTASISHSLQVVAPGAYRPNTIRQAKFDKSRDETIVARTIETTLARMIETIVARSMAELEIEAIVGWMILSILDDLEEKSCN